MKKYTKEEILKAAELGEVSMIDAEHIVSLLKDARKKGKFDCRNCVHSFMNPFDQYYCHEDYDLEKEDCGGKLFKDKRPTQ